MSVFGKVDYGDTKQGDKISVNIFNTYCIGYGTTKEEAIESFRFNLHKIIIWIRGTKYWRRKPFHSKQSDFDSDLVEHWVKARIICAAEPIEGFGNTLVKLDCEIK